ILWYENVMPGVANRRLRNGALVAEEAKEALHDTEPGCHGAGGELAVEGGLDPGIDIGRCGLRQILIEEGLAGLGHQDGGAFTVAIPGLPQRRGHAAGM